MRSCHDYSCHDYGSLTVVTVVSLLKLLLAIRDCLIILEKALPGTEIK